MSSVPLNRRLKENAGVGEVSDGISRLPYRNNIEGGKLSDPVLFRGFRIESKEKLSDNWLHFPIQFQEY